MWDGIKHVEPVLQFCFEFCLMFAQFIGINFLGVHDQFSFPSLVLIWALLQTILWSLPVLMLLSTDRSEKIPCLSVRM